MVNKYNVYLQRGSPNQKKKQEEIVLVEDTKFP